MSKVFGFSAKGFEGAFSSQKKAEEYGCIEFEEIDSTIVEDDIVYGVLLTITTWFDQDIMYIYQTESTEDSISHFTSIITSKEDIDEIVKEIYKDLSRKEKREVTDDDGNICTGEIIRDISLESLLLEVDEAFLGLNKED